jgi:folate/biopterin transporter
MSKSDVDSTVDISEDKKLMLAVNGSNETLRSLGPESNDIAHFEATGLDGGDEFTFKGWVQQKLFLGIEPSPDIIAIATIYFVEGALGLARLAQTYLLKDELALGPAEMSALTGALVLPWTIKPLYGFLSDGFPLFGFRRKSYLIVAGLSGGLSYSVLSLSGFWESLDKGVAISGTVGALLLSSACIAMSDVVADGIVVTRTRQAKDPAIAGGLQSLCWGSAAVGGLLSAYFSGALLEVMSIRSIFGITAVLPFMVALIALQMEEKPYVKEEGHEGLVMGVKDQANALWEALKQPSIWKPTLFLFLWQSTPTSDGAFFYFMSNDLGLGPEFMGRVRLVTSLATLGGVVVYNQYLKRVPIKSILFWSTIASFPLGMLPVLLLTHVNRELGIPDQALIFGDDIALAALGEIAFLPTLVLAARLCPPGVEAVLFATLMSVFNGAGTVGTELGALLTKLFGVTDSNFDNLVWLTVLCNVTSLYPLFFIGWLDKIGDVSEEEMESKKGVIETTARTKET